MARVAEARASAVEEKGWAVEAMAVVEKGWAVEARGWAVEETGLAVVGTGLAVEARAWVVEVRAVDSHQGQQRRRCRRRRCFESRTRQSGRIFRRHSRCCQLGMGMQRHCP